MKSPLNYKQAFVVVIVLHIVGYFGIKTLSYTASSIKDMMVFNKKEPDVILIQPWRDIESMTYHERIEEIKLIEKQLEILNKNRS